MITLQTIITFTPSFDIKSNATLILRCAFSMEFVWSSQGRLRVGKPKGSAPKFLLVHFSQRTFFQQYNLLNEVLK